MAFKTKTVRLSQPVTAFNRAYHEIIMREPSAAIFLELGPLSTNYRSGTIESTADLPGVLATYLERCVTNVEDAVTAMPVILSDLPLEDGVRLRRGFNEFFSEAVDAVLAEEAAKVMANATAAAATVA